MLFQNYLLAYYVFSYTEKIQKVAEEIIRIALYSVDVITPGAWREVRCEVATSHESSDSAFNCKFGHLVGKTRKSPTSSDYIEFFGQFSAI